MTAGLPPVLVLIISGLVGLVLIPLGLPGLWVILLGIIGLRLARRGIASVAPLPLARWLGAGSRNDS
jgi:hypothetical protein